MVSRGFALIYGLQHCINDVIDSLECFLQLCRILAACGCAVRTTAAALMIEQAVKGHLSPASQKKAKQWKAKNVKITPVKGKNGCLTNKV